MGVLLSVFGCFWVRFGRFGVVAGGVFGVFPSSSRPRFGGFPSSVRPRFGLVAAFHGAAVSIRSAASTSASISAAGGGVFGGDLGQFFGGGFLVGKFSPPYYRGYYPLLG